MSETRTVTWEKSRKASAVIGSSVRARCDASMRAVTSGIHGHCDPRFARVRDAFAHNFAAQGELGASLCVIAQGRTVVDLSGGATDATGERSWSADTLVIVH